MYSKGAKVKKILPQSIYCSKSPK